MREPETLCVAAMASRAAKHAAELLNAEGLPCWVADAPGTEARWRPSSDAEIAQCVDRLLWQASPWLKRAKSGGRTPRADAV